MAHAVRRTMRAVLVPGVCALVAACGGGDEPPGESTTTTRGTAPATPTPTPAPTPTPPPTSPTTSTGPATVAPTSPATTAPPPTGNPFTADTVEVASPFFEQPFVMVRSAATDELVVYDGVTDDGTFAVRCVAVVREGESSWREGCFETGVAANFVVVDGIDPWIVEVGAEPGAVTLARRPFDWSITSSGCTEPVVSIADAADLGPAMLSGLWCAETEALLSFASVLLQPGPADGGHALLSYGDEGWNLLNRGTSLDCAGYGDEIDRCSLFDSDGELFGALPVPTAGLAGLQTHVVGVRDETETATAMAAGASDTEGIVGAIVDALMPAEPEALPTTTVIGDAGWGATALVVEIPALDDSTASTVYVVWIHQGFSGDPATVTRAFAWDRCARGVVDGGVCV